MHYVHTTLYSETPKLKAPREPTVRYLQISGNPLSAVTSSSKQDYKHSTDMQTIVYTNSKQQAVGSISAAIESVLENSPNDGEVILALMKSQSDLYLSPNLEPWPSVVS